MLLVLARLQFHTAPLTFIVIGASFLGPTTLRERAPGTLSQSRVSHFVTKSLKLTPGPSSNRFFIPNV